MVHDIYYYKYLKYKQKYLILLQGGGNAEDYPLIAQYIPELFERVLIRISCAPASSKGIFPEFIVETVLADMSNEATSKPDSAKTKASGSPTWPPPPTITIFCMSL